MTGPESQAAEVPQRPHDRIRSKADFDRFVAADLKVRGLKKLPFLYWYRRPIIHFTVMLRKHELLEATATTPLGKARLKWFGIRRKRIGSKLGINIGTGIFGPGLYIAHCGAVVVSARARIGANARVHNCVTIARAPVIGDNVYFGPGAVVTGDISIGDNVSIGANAVVARDIPAGATVMGNPGRIVKQDEIADPQRSPDS